MLFLPTEGPESQAKRVEVLFMREKEDLERAYYQEKENVERLYMRNLEALWSLKQQEIERLAGGAETRVHFRA